MIFRVFLASIFCAYGAIGPQTGSNAARPCGAIHEVMNPDGFAVPGVAREAKVKDVGRVKFDGVDDITTLEVTPHGSTVELPMASLLRTGDSDRIWFKVSRFEVFHISRYEKCGRVFSHVVRLGYVGTDKKGRHYPLGSGTTLQFYDPDGAGKMTVMRYTDSEMPSRYVVPEWIKLLSESPECSQRR